MLIKEEIDNLGNIGYFNAFTGKRVNLPRYRGGKTGKVPDYAFRFISPAPKKGLKHISNELPETRAKKRIIERTSTPKTHWLKRLLMYFKNLIAND